MDDTRAAEVDEMVRTATERVSVALASTRIAAERVLAGRGEVKGAVKGEG
jgi:hypothetical protein